MKIHEIMAPTMEMENQNTHAFGEIRFFSPLFNFVYI